MNQHDTDTTWWNAWAPLLILRAILVVMKVPPMRPNVAERYFNLASKFSSKSNSKLFHPSLAYQNRKTRSFAEQLSRIIITRTLNTHFKLCILHTASITPTYTVKFMPVCRFGQRVVLFTPKDVKQSGPTTRVARDLEDTRGERQKLQLQYYRVSRECVFLQLCFFFRNWKPHAMHM